MKRDISSFEVTVEKAIGIVRGDPFPVKKSRFVFLFRGLAVREYD